MASRALSTVGLFLAVLAFSVVMTRSAIAATPVDLTLQQDRIDLTPRGEAHAGSQTLQIDAATGADGGGGRMAIRAQASGARSSWFDKPMERWIAADRYATVGSGLIWPDLDARRIEAITPSIGFLPDRLSNDRADVFRITLEPGQVVTYAIELSSSRIPRLTLWAPIAFEKAHRERQLFHGILLGVTGLLAIFLTAVFAANHKAIFPSAALFTWAVIAYLCVDFGFWHQLFNVRPEENAQYRAAGEAAMVASLLIFLHTFLRLGFTGRLVRFVIGLWIVAELLLIGLAFLDPRLGATFARISAGLLGALGGVAVLVLALRTQDRALALMPTWVLFGVWLLAAALALTGRLTGDLVVNALSAGLVIFVVLIGFTVTQFAFRSIEPAYASGTGQSDLYDIAVQHSGAALWEWNPRRSEIRVGSSVEAALGLPEGGFPTKADGFLERVHPTERERLRGALDGLAQNAANEIRMELRLRHADNSFRWFDLDAANLPTVDRQAVRTIGLIREVTDVKLRAERLLHDAVHDSLTNLPNRALFLDRLNLAIARAKVEPLTKPLVLVVGVDKFRPVVSAFGIVVSESLIKTVARRLQRHVGPTDTIARIGAEQFGVLLHRPPAGPDLQALVDELRQAVRAPITIANHDVSLGVALGISLYMPASSLDAHRMVSQAEAALEKARLPGADTLQVFQPNAAALFDEAEQLEASLMEAIDKRALRVMFQPICYIRTEVLAGFEASLLWEHPRLGAIDPTHLAIPDEGGQRGAKLSALLLQAAVAEAQKWHKELPRAEQPLFVSVSIGGRSQLTPTLVAEVRHLVSRTLLPKKSLHIEFDEGHVMDNPEEASQLMAQLHAAGVGIALDDFGAGYTSLCYLNSLPAETIKVGPVLLHAANQTGPASAVLRSIVAVAREMGRRVIVEGVETGEDVGLLRALGVEYAQGPHYGSAVNARGALALVAGVKREEKRLQNRRAQAKPKQRAAPTPQQSTAARPSTTTQPISRPVAIPEPANSQPQPTMAAMASPPQQPMPQSAPIAMVAPPLPQASEHILARLDEAMSAAAPPLSMSQPQGMMPTHEPVSPNNGITANGHPHQYTQPATPPPIPIRPMAARPANLPPQLAASLARLAGRPIADGLDAKPTPPPLPQRRSTVGQ
jgi:diguanylate cyclase (GGDEF)-like protein